MDRNRNVNGNAICKDTGGGSIQMHPIRKDWSFANYSSVSLSLTFGAQGGHVGVDTKPEEESKAQAITTLSGPEGLLTWFFSNSFKEQPFFQRPPLSKITNGK